MLVTNQILDRIRAAHCNFTTPLQRSRSALLELYDYRFHHTLRAGNKTADWLANWAMDHHKTLSSSNTSRSVSTDIRTALYTTLPTDTAHHRTQPTIMTDMLSRIQQIIHDHSRHSDMTTNKRPRPLALSAPLARRIRPPQPL